MELYEEVVIDLKGDAIEGAQVRVLKLDGSDAIVFDAAGTQVSNPVPTGALGEFAFQAANGKYTLRILVGGVVYRTVGPVLLYDPSDVAAITPTEITPEMFGASGANVSPGDTAAVQAAFDDGRPVRFTRDYYVDSVKHRYIGRTVEFNNFELIGCAAAAQDYVLAVVGRESDLRNVRVNCNFLPYAQALRIFSESAGAPSQFNRIRGLRISNSKRGVLFGAGIGSTSTDAAQSEWVIEDYSTRAVQQPFIGNQSNGYVTLINPILDCSPYEWAGRAEYTADSNAWNTAACTINNQVGSLVVLGGELLKTGSGQGYGLRGKNVTMIGTVREIVGVQGYIEGDFTLRDGVSGYQSSDSTSAWVIAPGATGMLKLYNVPSARGAGVGGYSAVRYVDDTLAGANFSTLISGGTIEEWPWPLGGFKVQYRDVDLLPTAGQPRLHLGRNKGNILEARNVDFLTYTTRGWYLKTVFGGGTTMTIVADGPVGYLPSSLELHATGEAQATTVDETSAATITATGIPVKPGELWTLTAQAKRTAGSNARLVANFYTAAGVVISLASIVDSATFSTSTFGPVGGIIRVPANAAYMGVGAYNAVSDLRFTDLKLERA